MSVIKDVEPEPLAESADDCPDYHKSELVSKYGLLKENLKGRPTLPHTKFHSYNGGYFGLNEWNGCLASVKTRVSQELTYVYFPSGYLEAEKVLRWCKFITDNYDFKSHYVGEFYIAGGFYGTDAGSLIRSHVIALPRQPWYSKSKFTILAKVSMIRYLYRADHYKSLIEPIYEMVELGIDPWDALIMAHYYLNAKIENSKGSMVYSTGTSLMSVLHAAALLWPRSIKDIEQFFFDYTYTNNVFGGHYFTSKLFYPVGNEAQVTGQLVYAQRLQKDRFFGVAMPNLYWAFDPYAAVFKEDLNTLLLKRKWVDAFNLYVEFLKTTIKPSILFIRDSFNKHRDFGGAPTFHSVMGGTRLDVAGTNYTPKQIIEFIDSLKPISLKDGTN